MKEEDRYEGKRMRKNSTGRKSVLRRSLQGLLHEILVGSKASSVKYLPIFTLLLNLTIYVHLSSKLIPSKLF